MYIVDKPGFNSPQVATFFVFASSLLNSRTGSAAKFQLCRLSLQSSLLNLQIIVCGGLVLQSATALAQSAHGRSSVPWAHFLWNSVIVSKHFVTAWLFLVDRNPTLSSVNAWNQDIDITCLLCGSHDEARSHLFFYCSYCWYCWNTILGRFRLQGPPRSWYSLYMHETISVNIKWMIVRKRDKWKKKYCYMLTYIFRLHCTGTIYWLRRTLGSCKYASFVTLSKLRFFGGYITFTFCQNLHNNYEHFMLSLSRLRAKQIIFLKDCHFIFLKARQTVLVWQFYFDLFIVSFKLLLFIVHLYFLARRVIKSKKEWATRRNHNAD